MHICFATDGIFPHVVGGMQRHSRLLIEELAKDSSITLTVIHPSQEKLFSGFSNIKEYSIPPIDINKNYLSECYSYSKNVYLIMKNKSFDVVYSQGLSVWYRASEFSHKLIVNPHGLEPFQAMGRRDKAIAVPFRFLFRRIFRKARFVISLGGKLTTILQHNTAPEKVVVIPNAVNLPAVREIKMPHEPMRMLFVARFASNKGVHVLMEAIQKLNKKGFKKKLQFNLAGKGPLYESYLQRYLISNVKFLGFVPDEELPQIYKHNDAFVFPTLFEGMPTVVLEAMSYGMPVVVTDVGATAQLVDEKNGFLIERDNVDALVHAIEQLLQMTPEQFSRLSVASYEKVNQGYTWKHVAEEHKILFHRIAADK
jgi:glycosyltransferase involved in cell wall biosynthesis